MYWFVSINWCLTFTQKPFLEILIYLVLFRSGFYLYLGINLTNKMAEAVTTVS